MTARGTSISTGFYPFGIIQFATSSPISAIFRAPDKVCGLRIRRSKLQSDREMGVDRPRFVVFNQFLTLSSSIVNRPAPMMLGLVCLAEASMRIFVVPFTGSW